MSDELLPCPFCGKTDLTYIDDMFVSYIECYECDLRLGYGNKEELIKKWNNRASQWVTNNNFIKVTKDDPKEGESVLGYYGNNRWATLIRRDNYWQFEDSYYINKHTFIDLDEVKYYLPLPKSPEDKDEDEYK